MDTAAEMKQKQNLKTALENYGTKGEMSIGMTLLPHTVEHSWAFSHVSMKASPHICMTWVTTDVRFHIPSSIYPDSLGISLCLKCSL